MADTQQLVRQQIDLFNQGKIDELLEKWTEDAELVTPMAPPLKGREAVAQYWKQMKESFPDARVTIHRMVGEGDITATEYTFTATNTGPLYMPTGEKLPATGKRMEVAALDIGVMEDGKVKSLHQYFDTVPGLVQLGLMPAPSQAPR